MNEGPKQSRWNSLKDTLTGRKPGSLSEPGAPVDGSLPAEPAPVQSKAQDDCPPSNDDQARLAALYRVSRVLGTSLDLDEVLAQVLDAVIELTGAERGLLVMIENETGDWKLRLARNINPEKLNNWEQEVSSTIINMVLKEQRGVVTSDAQSDSRFSTSQSVFFNVLRSMMCAPLLARGRTIGAIYVDSRIQVGIFDQEDLDMMDTFATQAAFAIDNARIYARTVEKVQQLTIELDTVRRDRQVAEITETEYFRKLQERVAHLRQNSRRGNP
jgi:GAF domain-containing protein